MKAEESGRKREYITTHSKQGVHLTIMHEKMSLLPLELTHYTV